MLISYSKKFIFIHIYKTAGMSIRTSLSRYQAIPNLELPNRAINLLAFGIRNYHLSSAELKQKLPNRIFENYFKFAFVRNPWDWQVSLYHYMKQTEKHHQNHLANGFETFENYLNWRINNEVRLQVDFIMENNTSLVNYIGRVETIDDDLKFLEKKLDLDPIILPKINKSKRSNYQDYYNNRTKDLVYQHFKKDIETFEYSF